MDNPNPEFPAAVNAHLVQSSSHPPLYRESLSEEEEAIGAGSDQVAASVMHDEVARLSSRGGQPHRPGRVASDHAQRPASGDRRGR